MPTQSYFKSKCKKHNMTYTLYCKITFWSKARIYWLPNSSFSERISNAKPCTFPLKTASAEFLEALAVLTQNAQSYFQAEKK